METIVLDSITLTKKQEVLNALFPIKTDYPEYDGDVYSTVDFSINFETQNFYVVISGEVLVEWRGGDFKFDCVSSINVVINSHNGEVSLEDEFINQITNNLEFQNL
ncbi:hypothetical protein [Tenacibaculum caenipelagi]|uniref:Uncharacterized protein n=1 Tax=Tenacibaculum caenipelagi TaxID=1325435 RepID=A0A4R6TCY3_9FLAO|nr:hypothetical protein [Tenacibaculum caenipelagi]TDQ27685.1 hypothetical protein DFQ07_1536 [Tenacibaculum caenipelagi]